MFVCTKVVLQFMQIRLYVHTYVLVYTQYKQMQVYTYIRVHSCIILIMGNVSIHINIYVNTYIHTFALIYTNLLI